MAKKSAKSEKTVKPAKFSVPWDEDTSDQRLDRIKAMTNEQRLLYWVKERHNIYLKKEAGLPKPWTPDPILQQYYFTNPYREHDRVTVWFKDHIREPLRNSPDVLFATVCFRWFNRPSTGQVLLDNNLLREWDEEKCDRILTKLYDEGETIFTNAFVISSGIVPGNHKITNICAALTGVWNDRNALVDLCRQHKSLETTHRALERFHLLGGFMAYEIVTDLRHTYLLEDATDKMTWCNRGPGAQRGMARLLGLPLKAKIPVSTWKEVTQGLLHKFQTELADMPPFEMREVEHSLCEWDKMERARSGEGGRMKRKYNGIY